MAIKSVDVRAAREFLRKRGVKGVSPRDFARSAEETGSSYKTLLKMYAALAEKSLAGGERSNVHSNGVRA